MGRPNSCFKIITCGSDSAAEKDDIDIQTPENKGSNDKRGWSFRKKSASHRVLSNSVASEAPSTANKESIEPDCLNYQQRDTASVPEKKLVAECIDEKPLLSISVDEKGSKTIALDKDGKDVEAHVEESVAIILQSSARTFMAQKELDRLKSVVKLQAAIRGHLVRQHAVGSLRCVQAIVKMQVLIRARHARTQGSNVETGDERKASSETSKMELSVDKPPVTYTSLQKLLGNRFARQLMESTPKSRPINIKCDPLQPNSTWTWFERWMAPSPVEPTPKPESSCQKSEGSHVVEEKKEEYASPLEESDCSHIVKDSRSKITEVVSSSKREEYLNAYYDASNSSFKAGHSLEDKLELPHCDVSIPSDDVKEASIYPTSRPQKENPGLNCQPEPGQECEQPQPPEQSIKRLATEELATDQAKEITYGPRKVSDPAFVATLSKFEGLSSATGSNKASSKETLIITKEPSMADNSVDHFSSARHVDSECGPKLSVTSSMDSPDHTSEVGPAESKELTISEEPYNPRMSKNVDDEEFRDTSEDPLPIPDPVVFQPEEIDGVENEAVMIQREKAAESAGADVVYKSSPEASPPRSHTTVPAESHGTPASQVSVSKSEKAERRASSNHKRKSLSAGNKKMASSPQNDSAKDQKKGKRRSSFGSPRRDDELTDNQEPRPSNGNNSSLPRFMLATESAKAKLQANNSSPRSSPDANDREYIKKRHSLPGANGRHGSPKSKAESAPKSNASLVSRGMFS
ncbi:Protein IQ-DOMAIN 32 [Linum perenne]